VIIGVAGAMVGHVKSVRSHPQGMFIWLADVDLGNGCLYQIVFGGDLKLGGGELVAVVPPGSRATVHRPNVGSRHKKMRARRYRGERSHGMLCSLDELGWVCGGPNEVAILCDVVPGQSLDDLPVHRRPEVVVGWERARLMEKRARSALTEAFNPAVEVLG